MQKVPQICTGRRDKIFIHAPILKETRLIKILPRTEVCVLKKDARAFVVRRTRISQLQKEQEKKGYFVFDNCDSGIVVCSGKRGFSMVYLKFEEEFRLLTITCDLAESWEELRSRWRYPEQLIAVVETAINFNRRVKKITPPMPQLAVAY